ncbi:hypothetical protein F511_21972 [Dorcoceras hygrometricum]|uniref:C2H2-type domain-containing protein n=1 Tax=Dorcoceras hygrometricum TaxID=472368 RepID=A0A2Z7CFE3_9LAMI|nr:hypothetical protein F511_21972 [Dorcoceras hygrometricum]
MEESQERRYICKICSKSCVSGKSLGGHMRIHLAQISASKKAVELEVAIGVDSESGLVQNDGFQLEKPSNDQLNSTFPSVEDIKNRHSNTDYEESDLSNSYELRENPKKSWRISNPKCGISRKAACCKLCHKRFPSVRALSGHMRFHSTKSKGLHQCATCGKAFSSIRAMFGHMKSHSKKLSRARGESSDNDSVDLGNLCPVRKKRSRVRYKIEESPLVSSSNASPSVVFEFGEEDAAVCLLMLSIGVTESTYNDSAYFGAGSFSKSREINGSDENFVCAGVKISNVSECDGLGSIKTPKMLEGSSVPIKLAESDKDQIIEGGIQETDSEPLKSLPCKEARLSVHDMEKNSPQNGASNLEIAKDSEKKNASRQKMLDKNSKSHHAIASHRASHRVPKNSSSVDKIAGQLSVNGDPMKHDDKVECIGIRLEQGTKDYQCSTCFKLFGSGRALGGHKRAHHSVFAESKTEESTAQNQQCGIVNNFLDLNVPLTADEGSNGHAGLNLWRVDRGRELEALVLTN